MATESNDYVTVSKYDRIRGGLADIAMFTKPSTVKNVQTITGESETFVVETCRHEELGDYLFIEMLDKNGVIRLAIPPRVCNLIASQRDALTARRRSAAGKRVAKARKEAGLQPGFMKKNKAKENV